MEYSDILQNEPYSLGKKEKQRLLMDRLEELHIKHISNCAEYRKITECIGFNINNINSVADFPFIPVRLFKEINLKSVPDKDILKL